MMAAQITDAGSAQPRGERDAAVITLIGVAHLTSHFFHLILAPLFPWLKDAFNLQFAQLGLLGVSALGLATSRSYGSLMFFEAIAGLGNSVFHPSGFTILNQRVSVR